MLPARGITRTSHSTQALKSSRAANYIPKTMSAWKILPVNALPSLGGGISAVQQLAEVSDVAAQTFWYTRSKPFFRASFTAEEGGRQTIDKVTKHTEAGNPPRSIVSFTGLIFNQDAKRAHANGALNRRPMFQGLYDHGIIEKDGTKVEVDAIIWAIGFRPSLSHLDPLDL